MSFKFLTYMLYAIIFCWCVHEAGFEKYRYYFPRFPFCDHPHARGTKSLTNNLQFNIMCRTVYCRVTILDGNKIQVIRQTTCVFVSLSRVRINCYIFNIMIKGKNKRSTDKWGSNYIQNIFCKILQMLEFILIIKPNRCTNFSNLFLEGSSTCFGQFLCLSSGIFHCRHNSGICHTGLLYLQWKNPDDGHRNSPKHVEYYSKNKLEKLVHLVGFIIRIFHDARPSERQKWNIYLKKLANVSILSRCFYIS